MRSRQLEILLYLMETKKSTYAELANHFEVSKKTIMRDIDKISGMGVPVYTQPGYEGGVFLAPDYRFDRSFFTAEEIEDIILAFHIARHFKSGAGKSSALKKLELLKNAVFWAVPISDLLILFFAIIYDKSDGFGKRR